MGDLANPEADRSPSGGEIAAHKADWSPPGGEITAERYNMRQVSVALVEGEHQTQKNVMSKYTKLLRGHKGRRTLHRHKLYLDSCATYHVFFAIEFLDRIFKSRSSMNGNCNAGSVSTNLKGMWGKFQVWVNENGIANLLSIPMLEKAGYKVSSHTDKNWSVFTPEGDEIEFKRDTGVTEGMPYIDLRTTGKAGLALIETIAKNMEGFTRKEVKRAKESRIMQGRIGHQSTQAFKQIV